MQARYYDPVIGRFYSNDPVGFSNVHNFNRYAYANNNPYKYVDPDGKTGILVALIPPVLVGINTPPSTTPSGGLPQLSGSPIGGSYLGNSGASLPNITPEFKDLSLPGKLIATAINAVMSSDGDNKANRKKQGREVAQKKRKKGWVDNGNNRRAKQPKKHTPSKTHQKHKQKKKKDN